MAGVALGVAALAWGLWALALTLKGEGVSSLLPRGGCQQTAPVYVAGDLEWAEVRGQS